MFKVTETQLESHIQKADSIATDLKAKIESTQTTLKSTQLQSFKGNAGVAAQNIADKWERSSKVTTERLMTYKIVCQRAITDVQSLKQKVSRVAVSVGASGTAANEIIFDEGAAGDLGSAIQGARDIDINSFQREVSNAWNIVHGIQLNAEISGCLSRLNASLDKTHATLGDLQSAINQFSEEVGRYESTYSGYFSSLADPNVDPMQVMVSVVTAAVEDPNRYGDWIATQMSKGHLTLSTAADGTTLIVGACLWGAEFTKGAAEISTELKSLTALSSKAGGAMTGVAVVAVTVETGGYIYDAYNNPHVTNERANSDVAVELGVGVAKAGVSIGSAVVTGMAAGAVGGPGGIVVGAAIGLSVGLLSYLGEGELRNNGTIDAIKDDYEVTFHNQVENWEEQHMIYREYGCA